MERREIGDRISTPFVGSKISRERERERERSCLHSLRSQVLGRTYYSLSSKHMIEVIGRCGEDENISLGNNAG